MALSQYAVTRKLNGSLRADSEPRGLQRSRSNLPPLVFELSAGWFLRLQFRPCFRQNLLAFDKLVVVRLRLSRPLSLLLEVPDRTLEIGRASCRERVCHHV